MKKIIALCLMTALTICGCQVREEGELAPEGKVFTATIETLVDDAAGVETKTSLDSRGNVLWKQGDQVSIFAGSTINEQYQVTDASDGKTAAALNRVTNPGFVAGTEIQNNVALYPYGELAEIAKDGSSYIISGIELPATQTYASASFGNGAFPMVAVTSSTQDYNLKFKNVLGGIKLQLTGTATIKAISITGNNNEIICGASEVTVSTTTAPSISLTDASATTVTLDCSDGVQMNETTATAFIIALPPMTMEGGFTVTVTDTEGATMEIKTTKPQTITRSNILSMPAVMYEGIEAETTPPNNMIYYTTSDGNIVKPTTSDYFSDTKNSIEVFGANIVSNDYVDGQGILTFDDNVTLIGRAAFSQTSADNLETITIPQSVTTIDPGAFYSSSSVYHLNRFYGKFSSEDGRCLIDDGRVIAFAPYGLTEYTLPDGVSIIGSHSIESLALKSIVIPEGVKIIEDQAFYWSYKLETAILPQSLEYIGDKSIPAKYYSIPSGVKYIGILNNNALVDLNSAVPPEIADGAFNLTSCWIYVPKGTADTYKNMWPEYAERIREKSEQPLNEIWYTTNDGGPVTITHDDPYFTSWWKQKIISNNNGKIVFDAPVTIVGDCFEHSNLVSISFPDAADFGDGQGIFLNCPYLKTVSFGKYCQLIPFMCFSGCDALEEVIIPDSVKKIGYRAFYGCTLSSITIPEGVTIGDYAFSHCTNLTSITIPDDVIHIYPGAFSGCTGLTSITIPSSVTSIERSLFSGCTGLTSITIPRNVTSIGSSAFSGCTGLTSITIPSSVTSIDAEAFEDCTGLTSITIPSSVTSIERSLFSNCTGLTSITIPSSVTSIGDNAFSGCTGLTSITIPSSVTSIGYSAFSGCNSITSYTVLSPAPPTLDSFSGFYSSSGFIIYVPASSVEAYKSARNWCYLSDHIQEIPE